jgi:glucose/mannose-6-phosphate isomerase
MGPANVLALEDIKAVDKQGLWEAYTKWPASTQKALGLSLSLPRRRILTSVVLGGMGGSGSACDILAGWLGPRIRLPVTVVKDYHLPGFVRPDTLVIAVSLSGDTKETISLLRESIQRRCSTVGFSSGGKLETLCREQDVPFNRVERLLVPRASIPGMVILPARTLVQLGLVEVPNDFARLVASLEETLARIGPSVGFGRNTSKKLAKSLQGKNVVVYSSGGTSSLAHHFKASMNENAKVQVQVDDSPELFHNEVETWVAGRNRMVVVLRKKDGEDEVAPKFRELKRILRKRRVAVAEFVADTDDIGSVLSLALTLDLATLYLAVLGGTAPALTPVLGHMRTL